MKDSSAKFPIKFYTNFFSWVAMDDECVANLVDSSVGRNGGNKFAHPVDCKGIYGCS